MHMLKPLILMLLSQSTHNGESAAAIKALLGKTRGYLKGQENVGISKTSWDPFVNGTTHTIFEQSLAKPRKLQSLMEFLAFSNFRMSWIPRQEAKKASDSY